MKYIFTAVLLVVLNPAMTVFASDGDVMIHDAWVREAPPNAKMLAGYFSIMNHGAQSKSLVGANSPQFERVELHRTVMEGGMAKMVPQDSIEIPVGQTVNFEPGGLHLMLINPVKPLKAGDSVELTLKFNKGATIKVEAIVKKGGRSAQQEHHHEHMHNH
ncbi:copper chaperone PCu(A)C [Kaarinaea lacus]